MTDEPRYLIWSIEHTAWWRPDEWGYTTVLSAAGWYSLARGSEIVLKARGNECLIPEWAVTRGQLLGTLTIDHPAAQAALKAAQEAEGGDEIDGLLCMTSGPVPPREEK